MAMLRCKAGAANQMPQVKLMSVIQLAELMANPGLSEDVQFIDVREEHELQIAKFSDRFKLRPLSTFDAWSKSIASDFDPTKETVVLCRSGGRSMKMCSFLLNSGFIDVANVEGGILAWSAKVDPSIPQY